MRAGSCPSVDERVGDRFDEARRAADVDERTLAPAATRSRRGASRSTRPVRPFHPCGCSRVNVIVVLVVRELVAVDQVAPRARRVQEPDRDLARGRAVVAEHRPQRDDAGAARDEEERAAERLPPDEVAADRAAQLELVPGLEASRQVRRHLAVVEPLDGEDEVLVLRRGRDRVAALRLVAVLGREPHVDVLAGAGDPASRAASSTMLFVLRVLRDDLDHARELPGQSPAYRCSFHGSP